MSAPFRAAVAGLAIAVAAAAPALAQSETLRDLRIGFVVPSRSGLVPVTSSVNDYTGEGALMGARLSEASLAGEAQAQGIRLDLLLASSPSAEAAARAAERLVEVEDVAALVGGIGEGQARAIQRVAEAAGVPFFNIGETADALRGAECGRHTFHIEASAAMYLDAMAATAAAEGTTDWFVVHIGDEAGTALAGRAKTALARFAPEGKVVGTAAVPPMMASYEAEIAEAETAGANAIVLLLDPFDQMVFLQQQEARGSAIAVLSFPHTLTQTRDFIAAARYVAPGTNPRHRVALWETTIGEGEAAAFNEAFRARWGEPADPTGWAAYHAVSIMIDTVAATGSVAPADVVAYLERPDVNFDVLKGPGVSFRPWDHQLRQPLLEVAVDQEVEWQRMSLQSQIDIAGFEGWIPEVAAGTDPAAELDRLGDGAEESSCRF